MNFSLKDRHLFGMGAAACAVCCAAPLLALLGVAGVAATVVTFLFAGAAFGIVVAAAAGFAVWQRQRRLGTCEEDSRQVDVTISRTRPDGHS